MKKVEKNKTKKEAYTKPEVHAFEPLRNITAGAPCMQGGGWAYLRVNRVKRTGLHTFTIRT